MAARDTARLYRRVAREFTRASTSPRNKDISISFRSLFEKYGQSSERESLHHDVENIVTFMRSQTEYKSLLERYNPLIDLTADERIEATARRVGLNMPKPVTRDD